MAITTGQLALTTTAALVVSSDVDGCRVMFYVKGNNAVYLGASNVTTSTGLELRKEHGITEFRLCPGDNLYAVTATTETLTYMIVENA